MIGCCAPTAAHQHARDLVAPILESLQQLGRASAAEGAEVVDESAADEIARELLVLAVVLRFLDTLPPAGPGQEHPAVAVFGECISAMLACSIFHSSSCYTCNNDVVWRVHLRYARSPQFYIRSHVTHLITSCGTNEHSFHFLQPNMHTRNAPRWYK